MAPTPEVNAAPPGEYTVQGDRPIAPWQSATGTAVFVPSFRDRLRQIVSLLRLTPFDISSAAGRSKERYRRIALSAAAMVASKAVSLVGTVITVPLTLHYLGTERYGLWMTISSFIAMLSFADLGMGCGLMNAISQADGKDDREAARNYVSSALAVLCVLAVCLAGCFALVHSWIPWARVFNISSPVALAETGVAVAVLFGCFAISMPLGVVQRVQMGYQESFSMSLWTGVGSVFALGGVLLAVHMRAGLPWLVLATSAAPILAGVINGVVLFGYQKPWLRPNHQCVSLKSAMTILKIGLLFFILQIVVALAYSSDNIVAAHVLGPEAVTQYAVPLRLFAVVPMLLGMVIAPLWPAYGEAIARQDTDWVATALRRSLVLVLAISAPVSLFFVVFGGRAIHFWVGPAIHPSLLLLVGMAFFTVLTMTANVGSTLLNGANVIRFQVVTALLVGITALGAKILLARWIGLPGIIWGTTLALFVFMAVPNAVFIPRLLRCMRRQASAIQNL